MYTSVIWNHSLTVRQSWWLNFTSYTLLSKQRSVWGMNMNYSTQLDGTPSIITITCALTFRVCLCLPLFASVIVSLFESPSFIISPFLLPITHKAILFLFHTPPLLSHAWLMAALCLEQSLRESGLSWAVAKSPKTIRNFQYLLQSPPFLPQPQPSSVHTHPWIYRPLPQKEKNCIQWGLFTFSEAVNLAVALVRYIHSVASV